MQGQPRGVMTLSPNGYWVSLRRLIDSGMREDRDLFGETACSLTMT
jgi:hypothetical protein